MTESINRRQTHLRPHFQEVEYSLLTPSGVLDILIYFQKYNYEAQEKLQWRKLTNILTN